MENSNFWNWIISLTENAFTTKHFVNLCFHFIWFETDQFEICIYILGLVGEGLLRVRMNQNRRDHAGKTIMLYTKLKHPYRRTGHDRTTKTSTSTRLIWLQIYRPGNNIWNNPANTRRWSNVGLLLGQRRRRWTNSKPDVGPTSHVCWDVTCVSSWCETGMFLFIEFCHVLQYT